MLSEGQWHGGVSGSTNETRPNVTTYMYLECKYPSLKILCLLMYNEAAFCVISNWCIIKEINRLGASCLV